MKEKIYKAELDGIEYDIKLYASTYVENGALAVTALTLDSEPFAVFTENLNESGDLPPCMAFMRESDSSEWKFSSEWKLQFLKDNGIAQPTDRTAVSGFCVYRAYRFNMDKLIRIKQKSTEMAVPC